MSINWDGFKSTLKSYFMTRSARNYNDAADFIALQYDVTVRSGGEMVANNFVVKPNSEILSQFIKASFIKGYGTRSGYYDSLNLIGKGLMLYWTGATLAQAFPPPGTVAVLSNIVTNAGKVTSAITPPTSSNDFWVDVFVLMARTHLYSLQGQMVALIVTPTGAMPIVVPWVGYQ